MDGFGRFTFSKFANRRTSSVFSNFGASIWFSNRVCTANFLPNIQKTLESRKLFIEVRIEKIGAKLYLLAVQIDTDTLSQWPLGGWRAYLSSRKGIKKGDDR
jgi:hypothetical protein